MNKRLFAGILLASSIITLISVAVVRHNTQRTIGSMQSIMHSSDAVMALVRARTINEEDLKEWATELSSDEYGGRQAGYPGNNKAAMYIAKRFSQWGLKPGGDLMEDNIHRDFLQRFGFMTPLTGDRPHQTQNVVGFIEGSDPTLKKEIVVLGAHYDHVGQTGEGYHYARLGRKQGIWHGADDNASGTVTVMSIAKSMAQSNFSPKRTVVFILFSAEEGGLIGSKYYCDHPTVGDISNHVFMLNLDMIGRNPEKPTEIKGMASARGSYLSDVVSDAVKITGLSALIQNDAVVEGGDSDHSSFGDAGVSFVFFFTGFHDDYHCVSDTADKLAYGHMAQIGKTAARMIADIADKPSRPVFVR